MTEEKRINVFVGSPDTDASLRDLVAKKIDQWNKLNRNSKYVFFSYNWSDDCYPQTLPTPCDGQFCINTQLIDKCDLLIALIIDGTGTPYVKDGKEFPCATLYEAYYHSRINKKNSYIFLNANDARKSHLDWINKNRMGFFWKGNRDAFRENIFGKICQILSSYKPQTKPLSKYEIEVLEYAFQSPGYRFATRCTREGKYLITPAASKKPKPSEVLNADGNDKTNMLYKAAIKSLEEERKYIEKYRDPFQNCQFYELSALKFETIEKVLATGPTLVPKTTGKPVLVDEINPLDCNNTFDKIAQKIIFGAYRYGTHFWAITILCTQTTYFLSGEKQTLFLTCTLNEATEAIERLKEECLIKDLIFIEPNDGCAYILQQLCLQKFKQRLGILGEPLDIASGKHRITKEGRLYCQKFGNANNSK